MRKRGSEREKERGGGQERDRPSISTGAGAAFIRSTIGKRETLTGLNFSLIIMTPPHIPPPPSPVSPSQPAPPIPCRQALFPSCYLCSFVPSALEINLCVCSLWSVCRFLFLSGTVCIPLIFYWRMWVLVLGTRLTLFRADWTLSDDVTDWFTLILSYYLLASGDGIKL